jgi:hypothetical protein
MRLRSSSSIASVWPLYAAQCNGVDLRQTAGMRPSARRCRAERRTRCSRSGRRRRRWMRSVIGRFGDCRGARHSATRCIHCCARQGRGAGVGPRSRVPETQQQVAPRVTLSEGLETRTERGLRGFSPRDAAHAPSRPPLACPPKVQTEKGRDSARWQGSVRVSEVDVVAGTEVTLRAN